MHFSYIFWTWWNNNEKLETNSLNENNDDKHENKEENTIEYDIW